MKITQIEVLRVAIPFSSGRDKTPETQTDAYNAASPELTRMETLLIKISTDTGLHGWGEGFGHLCNPMTEAALNGLVGRFFLGQTCPQSPEEIAVLMQQAEINFHVFGRTGPVLFALSAVDIALWDLLAKARNQPLWQLLGAKRQKIGVYASLVSYGNHPERVAKKVLSTYQAGFRAIKLHETAYPAIAAAREVLPADAELMLDVNCPWNVEEAAEQAQALRSLNLGWLEEPVWPPDDLAGLAEVRKQGTRIAAGENAAGVQGFVEHFEHGSIDVAQPSVSKVGGITAMLKVFALAKQYHIRVVPHCFYYGAGLMATAQLVATLDDSVSLEVPYIQWQETLYPQLDFAPQMTLPDTPGTGFEPSPSVMKKYLISSQTLSLNAEAAHA
ncbi:mandelate racemase/muconate lactonizing enzyme family protein [Rahnella woolbedingensis]|uniref:Mandelate racemase/muconate lactonizing enzyme family protein n=1 Tax=Rahnella woolbedingensis TaxID=1510574 RepID=A0A419N584_9GAMM|nr:mandelate racemase/muconate lactonizing enzyme family protein [Rahnella woolbedingensis]RJT40824.1 mandelate racemase/muconate lactonizing enzyme family protein [Rahnella woolbedingensis]